MASQMLPRTVSSDEDDEEEAPMFERERAAKKAPAPVVDEDEDEDDEDGFSEEDLKAMSFGVLLATARSFGVSTKGKNADDIIAEIMESGEEDDEA